MNPLGSDGLRNVQLQSPSYIRRGEDLKLRCDYELEAEQLYMVKWFFGPDEFYRYVPKEAPAQQVFTTPDIHVNVSSKTFGQFFLLSQSHIFGDLLQTAYVNKHGLLDCSAWKNSVFSVLFG